MEESFDQSQCSNYLNATCGGEIEYTESGDALFTPYVPHTEFFIDDSFCWSGNSK